MSERNTIPYDEDYFERGVALGVSGYMNYTWMPEQTIRMAHHLIRELKIGPDETVLDYGCAKGYFVRALRLLDIPAYGVDISPYAIESVPKDVARFCALIDDTDAIAALKGSFDWVISKDVFEHIPAAALEQVLVGLQRYTRRLFLAIPLGKSDEKDTFVIPAYHQDVTHITIQPMEWWCALFESCGWTITWSGYQFRGMKENWTKSWAEGNGFFVLTRSD
jgi:SAM-dependent methyltransferase